MVILVNSYEWMELSPKYKAKLQYWHKTLGWDVGAVSRLDHQLDAN